MLRLPKRNAAKGDATQSPQTNRHNAAAAGSPVPGASPPSEESLPAVPPVPSAAAPVTPQPAGEPPTVAVDPVTIPRAFGHAGTGAGDPPPGISSPPPGEGPPPAAPGPGAAVGEPALVAPEQPNVRQRTQLRRRLRFLRRRRELELRDLGGLVFDLSRFGAQRPDLVQAKLEVLATTDGERRALEQALSQERPLRELREAGIGGVCPACGTLYASDARFCASCGAPLAAPAS